MEYKREGIGKCKSLIIFVMKSGVLWNRKRTGDREREFLLSILVIMYVVTLYMTAEEESL